MKFCLVGGMSRSGTTLMCSILASSENISFSDEILPPPTEDYKLFLKDLINNFNSKTIEDKYLRKLKNNKFNKDILININNEDVSYLKQYKNRFKLAYLLSKYKSIEEQKKLFGFKLNNSSIEAFNEFIRVDHFIGLIRNPLDLVLSNLIFFKKKTSIEDIVKNYNIYYEKYDRYVNLGKNNNVNIIIRIEDLINSRNIIFKKLFDLNSSFDFINNQKQIISKDKININHKNSKQILKGLDHKYKTNKKIFDEDQKSIIREINKKINKEIVKKYNYQEYLSENKNYYFFSKNFSNKKKFSKKDYEILISNEKKNKKILTLREIFLNKEIKGEILTIRHDIDHDINTAVKMAEWENKNSINSTFCVLHSSLYYGSLDVRKNRYNHNVEMLQAIRYIQSLGHEINYHNNIITLGLTEDINCKKLLINEILELFENGINISGSSTHGDKLCRQLEYRNWHLFKECDLKYKNSSIFYKSKKLNLREFSLKDFYLDCEAYGVRRDKYISDSGGTIKIHFNLNPHSYYKNHFINCKITKILTHPIWWNFD